MFVNRYGGGRVGCSHQQSSQDYFKVLQNWLYRLAHLSANTIGRLVVGRTTTLA
jgi:hypothetical protein